MKRIGICIVILACGAYGLLPESAFSYIRQLTFNTTNGTTLQIQWDASVVASSTNGLSFDYCCSSGFDGPSAGAYTSSESTFVTDVATSLGVWESAVTGMSLNFFNTFNTSSAAGTSSQEWDYNNGSARTNGRNSVIFSSNLSCIDDNGQSGCQCNGVDSLNPNTDYDSCYAQNLPQTVIGLTTTWFSLTTGKIIETDIQLNDRKFTFRTDATCGGDSGTQCTGTDANLKDVLTHELGHALGLDHSLTLASTMYPTADAGQQTLHADDSSGVRAIYAGNPAGYGKIRGTVVEDGNFLFGVQVTAIQQSGSSSSLPHIASALTYLNGEFVIEGLPAGQYVLFVEDFKGSNYLGSYYDGDADDSSRTNGSNPLQKPISTITNKGFVPISSSTPNEPLLVNVTSGATSQWVNADVDQLVKAESTDYGDTACAAEVLSGSEGFKAIGNLAAGNQDWFKITVPSDGSGSSAFFFRVQGRSVYSASDFKIDVYHDNPDCNTTAADSGTEDQDLESVTSERNKDAEEFFTGGSVLTAGSYYVSVTHENVVACSTTHFPDLATSSGVSICSGTEKYYVLTGGPIVSGSPYLEPISDTLSGSAPTGFIENLGVPGQALPCGQMSSTLTNALWDPGVCGSGCFCNHTRMQQPWDHTDSTGFLMHVAFFVSIMMVYGLSRRKGSLR